MAKKKILIVGFGTVGRGFFDLFNAKKSSGRLEFGDNAGVTEIIDAKFGHYKDVTPKSADQIKEGSALGTGQIVDLISKSDADILCEFTWVDIKHNAEPAYSHMKAALESGKHVITTNKGPIALRYRELKSLADSRGLEIKFKGTVMAGTPSYNLLKLLPGIDVKRFRGILNGTSNYILTEMRNGKTFDESLKLAQSKGYAEADPTMDVDGFDSALKAIIISNVLGWFGTGHSLSEMEVRGIGNIEARSEEPNKVTKLIVNVSENEASVKPVGLETTDILANVGGVLNALEIDTDTLGKIISIGPGAGKIETAQAVISDLGEILRRS